MMWHIGRKTLHLNLAPCGLGNSRAHVFSLFFGVAIFLSCTLSAKEPPPTLLPDPLSLVVVVQMAQHNRNEIVAARARAAAAHQRPAMVSALEDPMIQWSVDHYPYNMMDAMAKARYDRSFMLEQRFPLSGIRGHRRRSAEAEASLLDAETDRTSLDVSYEAVRSFHMLQESRRMRQVAEQQQLLATKLIAAASARYAAGSGNQSDVLRAETELARINARIYAVAADISAAEAMLNASIGVPVLTPVPALRMPALENQPPSVEAVRFSALQQRPELQAGQAAIAKAEADVDVMRAMYRPMATVGVGSATTMAGGDGAMIKIGISVPLWRSSLKAGVSEAGSMAQMARADLDAMQLMIESEAIVAREEVIAARVHLLALRDDVLPRAHMAIDPALAAYRAGQGGMVNVIEVTRALWSVETELVMAEATLGLAWAKLERAIGANWSATL